MNLFKLFSIKRKQTFVLLVAGLAILSVGAWWSLKTSVEADARSRLESQADRIEASIRDRLSTYANSLIHIRGHFVAVGVPSQDGFHAFVASLELPSRYPGINGVGYLQFVSGANVASFLRTTRANSPDFEIRPPGKRDLYAPVAMVEPLDWRNQKALGYDMLADQNRQPAIVAAAVDGEPTLTRPIQIGFEGDKERAAGFVLFLPYYTDTKVRPTQSEPFNGVAGMLYYPFRARDFFEGVLGAPSLKNETVNFMLEDTQVPSADALIYNRFDAGDGLADASLSATREFSAFGRKFRLSVRPLPHFYTPSDRYLPMIIGFVAAFISILILIVLKASQDQLIYESRARELSAQAAQKSRAQTQMLERLNDFARILSGELELEPLVEKFHELINEMARSQASFIYFNPSPNMKTGIGLVGARGLEEAALLKSNVPLSEMTALMSSRLLLQKSDRDSEATLQTLVKDTSPFSDWLLLGLPSRETGRCGMVFISRTDGTRFDDVEVEVIESLVAQAASAIENAKLFRKVEDASRAKNAFLANMSHEIRTPLNAIIGFSEMIAKRNMTELQRSELSTNLRRGGETLTRLIDDILDLSKIEAGKLSIEPQRVDLASVLQDVKSVMEPRATEKGVAFTIETMGEIPKEIMTDAIRLKQILLNLIGNAIKFTAQGSVLLHARYVRNDDPTATGGALAFRVKDTGIGISEDAQKVLFMPFSQGDYSSTRRFGGSGLGLALSRRLAQELGGDLELIESIQGEGSTFEARIETGDLTGFEWTTELFPPISPPTILKPERSNAARLDGARILLVEDSLDNQEIFRYFLENSGARVEIVDNGLDAVKHAVSEDYDIILMDIQIPEIDGKEATRRIRHQGLKKPIIALTAHALKEERESCLAAGCDGQITKPVSGENLITEIASYIRRHHGIAAVHS